MYLSVWFLGDKWGIALKLVLLKVFVTSVEIDTELQYSQVGVGTLVVL